uniref:Uncharacterized protein n=1 Tax=Candidozyma auris TaxID=498019 RepID=A0A0L0P3L7_CANAR
MALLEIEKALTDLVAFLVANCLNIVVLNVMW